MKTHRALAKHDPSVGSVSRIGIPGEAINSALLVGRHLRFHGLRSATSKSAINAEAVSVVLECGSFGSRGGSLWCLSRLSSGSTPLLLLSGRSTEDVRSPGGVGGQEKRLRGDLNSAEGRSPSRRVGIRCRCVLMALVGVPNTVPFLTPIPSLARRRIRRSARRWMTCVVLRSLWARSRR